MCSINDLVAQAYELEDELLCCEFDVATASEIVEKTQAVAARMATKTLLESTRSEIIRLAQ